MNNTSTSADNGTEPVPFTAVDLAAALTVKDVYHSMSWYRDVMGFAVVRQHEYDGKLQAVSLRAGNVRILINQDNGAKGWDRVKGEGLSLQLTTEQDVDGIAARVKELGATILMEPADTPWGARVFRMEDPDGFKLTISSVARPGDGE